MVSKLTRIQKHKKGQVSYFLESAFRIGFLMIALLAFFLIVNFYITSQVDTTRLEAEIVASRILYSDSIMQSDDVIGRTYPGIVDSKKFSNATAILDERLNYPVKRHATAKLELLDNSDGKTKYTSYLNKDQYDILLVVVEAKSKGKGAATRYIKYYPVTYIDDNGMYRFGTIRMSLIVPNS